MRVESNALELVSKVEAVTCLLTRSPVPRIVRRVVTGKIQIVVIAGGNRWKH